MPITRDINTKSNIRQKTDSDILSNLGQPVVAKYTATSTAGQTSISLNFLVDQNSKDNFDLFVDGRLLSEGSSADYQFSQIDGNNFSSTISLNVPLIANLNIVAFKRGLKRDAELGIDSRFTAIYDGMTAGFQGWVDESTKLTAVNGSPTSSQFRSSIAGRASIPDLANDMRARFGVDRIMVQQIVEVQNEYGPNGEKVFKALNDDRDAIRFVGAWNNLLSTGGAGVKGYDLSSNAFTNSNDFAEIVFYGTGLNVLVETRNNSSNNFAVEVDGSSVGNKSFYGSEVIDGRNYSENQIISVASGLSLGIHTVKIKGVTGTVHALQIYGFEILNEASTINVRPGNAYVGGKKLTLSAAQSLAYNSSFDSIYRDGVSQTSLSTRGARVLVYQKSDGSIGKSAIEVDSTQKNMTSADHSNEEMVRQYHFREFGAGRSDDFSSLAGSASNRAFALDDDTTNLIGQNLQVSTYTNITGVEPNGNGDFFTFTFVGTGLDVVIGTGTIGVVVGIYIDGTISQVGGTTFTANTAKNLTICSGLPYGTHTVKFAKVSITTAQFAVSSFRVYGPKKPTLPSGTIELADYNLMADFVANTTQSALTVSAGVLRKDVSREFVYVGSSWSLSASASDPVNDPTGQRILCSTNGDYFEYTFFGTGFDLRHFAHSDEGNNSVSLNGTTLTAANFPTATFSTYGGTSSFNSSTGVLSKTGSSNGGSGFVTKGLPLAKYTIRVTKSSGTNSRFQCIDIITPIHSHKSNLYADIQNTLPVGSCAISDNRKTSAIKEALPAQKAWVKAYGVTSGPTITSTSAVPVQDLSVTIKTNGGPIEIQSDIVWAGTDANTQAFFYIFVDGVQVDQDIRDQMATGGNQQPVHMMAIVPVSAGTHKIEIYANVTSAKTLTLTSNRRSLYVREL